MNKQKSQRQLQLAEQFKRTIAQIFLEDSYLQVPNIYLTVTEADISPDGKNCKVFISISGKIQEKGKCKIILELNNNSHYIKSKLTNNKTRYLPKLRFILDKTGDNANKINSLLD